MNPATDSLTRTSKALAAKLAGTQKGVPCTAGEKQFLRMFTDGADRAYIEGKMNKPKDSVVRRDLVACALTQFERKWGRHSSIFNRRGR